MVRNRELIINTLESTKRLSIATNNYYPLMASLKELQEIIDVLNADELLIKMLTEENNNLKNTIQMIKGETK